MLKYPRTLVLLTALVLAACAAKTSPIQQVQITHDALATAQDLEVNLCLGVPNVAAAATLPNVSHCTSPVAPLIKLTDALHADITAKFTAAITLHKSITTQFASGAATADLTLLQTTITDLLALIGQLQQTPAVVQLAATVTSARVK